MDVSVLIYLFIDLSGLTLSSSGKEVLKISFLLVVAGSARLSVNLIRLLFVRRPTLGEG